MALQELDVGRSPDECIQVVVSDAKVNVDSIEDVLGQIFENVLSHLDVDVSLGLVTTGPVADLDAGGVEGSVRVLVARHEYDVLEPVHPLHLAYFVEAAVLQVCLVAHAQLLEADRLAPSLQEPHARVNDR